MKRKLLFVMVLWLTLGNCVPIEVNAAESYSYGFLCETNNDTVMRADVIVKKYRMHYGVPQYRRWNETRGVWVDPDWIDL